MAGIDPHGPHNVEVMRLTKQMRKAGERAPKRAAVTVAPTGR